MLHSSVYQHLHLPALLTLLSPDVTPQPAHALVQSFHPCNYHTLGAPLSSPAGFAWFCLHLLCNLFVRPMFLGMLSNNPKMVANPAKREKVSHMLSPRMVCFVHNIIQVGRMCTSDTVLNHHVDKDRPGMVQGWGVTWCLSPGADTSASQAPHNMGTPRHQRLSIWEHASLTVTFTV